MRAKWSASAIVVALLAATPAGAQDERTIAEALFREGQRLLVEGRVAEACRKLAESQEVDPALGTLLNLATCHEREGKTASAWTEFSAALAEAARRKDSREDFARQRLAALESKLHYVVIDLTGPTPGTKVLLDGKVVGASIAGTPTPLDPGEHSVQVHAPGKQEWSTHVVASAEPGVEHVSVPELSDSPRDREPLAPSRGSLPPRSEPQASDVPALGLVLGGLSLVALGVAAVVGGEGIHDRATLLNTCAPRCASSDIDSVRTKFAVTDAFLITGIVAAGAAIASYFVLQRDDPSSRDAMVRSR
jgi:hypothetical protein